MPDQAAKRTATTAVCKKNPGENLFALPLTPLTKFISCHLLGVAADYQRQLRTAGLLLNHQVTARGCCFFFFFFPQKYQRFYS